MQDETLRYYPDCSDVGRLGHGLLGGYGGPDAFGYRYIDSDEAGGPAYDLEDISASGTRVTGLSDDNVVGQFGIGFNFEFYGNVYTQLWISSNCFLGFGTSAPPNGCCSSEPIPGGGRTQQRDFRVV